MKLVIAGASGFIGSALCSRLLDKGHVLALLTRVEPRDASTATKRWLQWAPGTPGHWETGVDGADGVINLAGEPIAAKRWTERQKQKILTSRIETTNSLVEAIRKAKQKPGFLINASAVGYYGPRGDETVTEEAAAGNDFLSSVCREWEEEAKKAESLGLRVIRVRTGIVLGRGGGALAKMVPPFKFFVGDRKSTRLNSSHQIISYAVFCLKKKKQDQLDWYMKTGEPMNKSAAYAIQGISSLFIDRDQGCYLNTVAFAIVCYIPCQQAFKIA